MAWLLAATAWLLAAALGGALLQHLQYWRRKQHIPGPIWVVPFVGSAIQMVRDPTKYWNDQASAAKKTGISCNYVLGRFTVFIRDSEMSQKVFANVKPEAFHLVGHPFGQKLFGENNLIFMFGEEHKDLRRRLAPLFTHRALSTYISIQEDTITKHITKWLQLSGDGDGYGAAPLQLRNLCRDMNLETSQNVFVGPYLTDASREQFTRDYYLFNVGLMALPINLPGYAFYEAGRAVERLCATLADCAGKSKRRMAEEGAEPKCLMDYWTVEILREMAEAAAAAPPPKHTSDEEVGHHIFDFLFAAQDASTSSLVWAITLLDGDREALARVREEQRRLSGGGGGGGAEKQSPEKLRNMKYTEMVVKEILRFRPPATLVPHIAGSDFAISDTFLIPKGSIVFPSLLESSFQGFTHPHRFDPDRFSPDRSEDQTFKRNFLVFGSGPHQCLGQRYAINQLVLFLSLFTTRVAFDRLPSPDRDHIVYTPTIGPKDNATFRLSPLPPLTTTTDARV